MGNSRFINTVSWNIHIHGLHTVYGCTHSTVADLSSKPSTLPSKSGHATSCGRLFLRLPPPLIPVVFIVTCQSFGSCHIQILIIIYFYVQYHLPHQMTKSLRAWDHVSGINIKWLLYKCLFTVLIIMMVLFRCFLRDSKNLCCFSKCRI